MSTMQKLLIALGCAVSFLVGTLAVAVPIHMRKGQTSVAEVMPTPATLVCDSSVCSEDVVTAMCQPRVEFAMRFATASASRRRLMLATPSASPATSAASLQ
jgi:hypothetical protein